MSSYMDNIFDNMSLDELVCRLPGENAFRAVKRRFSSLQDIYDILHSTDGKGISELLDIKQYINDIVQNSDIEEINTIFNSNQSFYKLFNILNDDTKDYLAKNGKYIFPIKIVFNLSNKDDLDSMSIVLDRVLDSNNTDDAPEQVMSILNNISVNCFKILVNRVLSDKRPEIPATILSVGNGVNYNTLSSHQKMIALKGFAKLPNSYRGLSRINSLDFKLFQGLKPLERLMALSRYFNNTKNKKQPFNPMPTREEMDNIVFAGCFQYYDLVNDIMKQYSQYLDIENQNTE